MAKEKLIFQYFPAEKYNANIDETKRKLKKLPFCSPNEIAFKGLTGWVFEQTFQKCLKEQLIDRQKKEYEFEEQIKLSAICKGDNKSLGIVDLMIKNGKKKLMIELKFGGFYGKDDGERYKKYRNNIKSIKDGSIYEYIYITGSETSPTYREKAKEAFEGANCFFFDEKAEIDSWEKLIKRITEFLG
ncbi:MAG: hypothetical protein ACOYMF_17955 [Bacteroidales bacterium]